MQEELICDICNQIVYYEEGKNPERVLNGHKIRCKEKQNKEMETTVTEEEPTQELRQGSREETPTEEPPRKKRVPFGVPKQHFTAPDNDGYHYRVFNSEWAKEPGRVERAKLAGYELVNREGARSVVGTNEDGSPITGMLMRIPQELYDEDQKLKEVELDKVDEQIYGGDFASKPGDKRYMPSDGGVKHEVKLTP